MDIVTARTRAVVAWIVARGQVLHPFSQLVQFVEKDFYIFDIGCSDKPNVLALTSLYGIFK